MKKVSAQGPAQNLAVLIILCINIILSDANEQVSLVVHKLVSMIKVIFGRIRFKNLSK